MLTNYSKFNVLNLIKGRRNTKQFSEENISVEEIEVLLEAAVWAPNHRNNEPWRFFTVRKGSPVRDDISNGIIALQERNSSGKLPDLHKQRITQDVAKQPWLIFVYSESSDQLEISEENYGAVCCAIQNMQLMATAMGLSVGWSTGGISKIENLDKIFGIEEPLKMVGVLTVGYPESTVEKTRTHYNGKTTWL